MKVSHLETLLYYDGPLIFIGKTDNRSFGLAITVDETEEEPYHYIYIFVETSERRAQCIKDSLITHYQAYRFPEKGKKLYKFVYNDEWSELSETTFEDIKAEKNLPFRGVRSFNSHGYKFVIRNNKVIKLNNKKGRHKSSKPKRSFRSTRNLTTHKFTSIKKV